MKQPKESAPLSERDEEKSLGSASVDATGQGLSNETGDPQGGDRITKMRKALEMVYEEHMQFGWGFEECHDAVIEALGGPQFINDYNKLHPISIEGATPAPREQPSAQTGLTPCPLCDYDKLSESAVTAHRILHCSNCLTDFWILNTDGKWKDRWNRRVPGSEATCKGQATLNVPRRLFEDLLEDAMELQGERDWWKDEPRLNYQKQYVDLTARIAEGVKIRDEPLISTDKKHEGVGEKTKDL